MKKIVLILLLFFVVSCNSSFEKLKSIDQLEGRWESKKDIIKIDTDKMTISYNKDSMTLILSSRPYDRSKLQYHLEVSCILMPMYISIIMGQQSGLMKFVQGKVKFTKKSNSSYVEKNYFFTINSFSGSKFSNNF